MDDEKRVEKKLPEGTAESSGNLIDVKNKSYLNENSTTENAKGQDFKDFTEADPVEPEDPKKVKGRYWCFVLYPESAPENWMEILNMSGLPWTLSPLHEHDINPDGTKKKPHWHVIVIWKASTTYNAVKKFTHETMCGTVPQVLHSPLGYYRYFTHVDNPEKYQYDESDIVSGNGFDIADYAKMTKKQRIELHMQLSQMIMDQCIGCYQDAVKMALSLGYDEYDILTSNTIHFTNLCKSVTYKSRSRKYEVEEE